MDQIVDAQRQGALKLTETQAQLIETQRAAISRLKYENAQLNDKARGWRITATIAFCFFFSMLAAAFALGLERDHLRDEMFTAADRIAEINKIVANRCICR